MCRDHVGLGKSCGSSSISTADTLLLISCIVPCLLKWWNFSWNLRGQNVTISYFWIFNTQYNVLWTSLKYLQIVPYTIRQWVIIDTKTLQTGFFTENNWKLTSKVTYPTAFISSLKTWNISKLAWSYLITPCNILEISVLH